MQTKSVKINAALNMCKTLLSIVFPLITFPYVSRVLQVENIGKINYTNSIVSYFLLVAGLGISSYATREGARKRNSRTELNEFVSEVFSFNILTTIIAYVALFICLLASSKLRESWILLLIQSFAILFITLGVDWINVIYEDYLYITVRSLFVQIISLICMFTFVREPGDYYKYAIITIAGTGIVSIANLVHIKKYCDIKLTLHCNIKKHIGSIMVLFSNNIAVSVYMNSDTTMLGWIVGTYEVGLYAVAVKIYSIVKNLIASVYAVVTARMSMFYAEGRLTEFKELLNEVINTVIFIAIPATVGMCFVSKDIIVLLSGEEYSEASTSLQILSGAFFFAIIGGILANCVNLPMKREVKNLKATTVSAIINIVLNLFMIPALKQNGAAFTTLLAEMTVSIMLFIGLKDRYGIFDFRKIGNNIIKCGIASIPIGLINGFLKNIMHLAGLVYLIPMIVLSALAYVLIGLVLKNEYVINVLKTVNNKYLKREC